MQMVLMLMPLGCCCCDVFIPTLRGRGARATDTDKEPTHLFRNNNNPTKMDYNRTQRMTTRYFRDVMVMTSI